MGVELVQSWGDDEMIARSARVSTGRDQLEQGKIEGLIGYLIREGHTSTLEHCGLTVRVHVPIFVHRQLMTHRTLSKNSESGRYRELEPVFYIPGADRPLINAGSGAHPNLVASDDATVVASARLMHRISAGSAWSAYQSLVGSGVATEVARNVLPVSIYTSAYLSGNLLAWFNFLRLRGGSHGHPQYEIQEVAERVASLIQEHYPIAFEAWRKSLE